MRKRSNKNKSDEGGNNSNATTNSQTTKYSLREMTEKLNDILNSNEGSPNKQRKLTKNIEQEKNFSDVRDRVQSMYTKSNGNPLAHSGEEYVNKTTGHNFISDSPPFNKQSLPLV
jgi:hypothetical protein